MLGAQLRRRPFGLVDVFHHGKQQHMQGQKLNASDAGPWCDNTKAR